MHNRFMLLSGAALVLVAPAVAQDATNPTGNGTTKEAIDLMKAQVDLQQAQFNLQKSKDDAAIAALTKLTEMRGSTEVKDGAGKVEAAALSLAAFNHVADQIRSQVFSALPKTGDSELRNAISRANMQKDGAKRLEILQGIVASAVEAAKAETRSEVATQQSANESAAHGSAEGFPSFAEAELCGKQDDKVLVVTNLAWQPDSTAMLAWQNQYQVLVNDWNAKFARLEQPDTKETALNGFKKRYARIEAGTSSQTIRSNSNGNFAFLNRNESGFVLKAAPALGLPAIIGGVSAILSAFKTDISISGFDLDKGDDLLISALIAQPWPGYQRIRPDMIRPGKASDRLLKALAVTLPEQIKLASNALDRHTKIAKDFTALVEKIDELLVTASGNPEKQLKRLKADIAKMNDPWATQVSDASAALKAISTFQNDNLFPSKDKPAPVVAAAKSLEQICLLRGDSVILRAGATTYGGSNYVRKRFWTSFGGTPWFVSSGVVATYTAYRGDRNEIIASGNVASISRPEAIRTLLKRFELEETPNIRK